MKSCEPLDRVGIPTDRTIKIWPPEEARRDRLAFRCEHEKEQPNKIKIEECARRKFWLG